MKYISDNDCYAIMGVEKNCDEATLKRVYKRLIMELHPDKQPVHARTEAHEAFVRMQNAFEMLSDNPLRRNYDGQRSAYFRTRFKSDKSGLEFPRWKAIQEACIVQKEKARKLQYDELRAKWRREAKKAEEELKLKEEHERREKEQKDKERREEQRRAEEVHERREREQKQKTQQQDHRRRVKQQAALKELAEEQNSVDIDFSVWKARQKKKREAEVRDRDIEKRHLKGAHEQAQNDLKQKHEELLADFLLKQRKELADFEERLRRAREGQLKKQAKEEFAQRERQHRQSEAQRQDRKRVREEYDAWQDHARNEMKALERGLDHPHSKRARPNFYVRSFFGFTKNGQPCQTCIHLGCFCKLHKEQNQA